MGTYPQPRGYGYQFKDNHRAMVTAQLLENQEQMLKEEREFLSEAPTNATGANISNFDPVLISLIRRSMPNLVAYDLAGVQPMNGPTGLIFAMRSRFTLLRVELKHSSMSQIPHSRLLLQQVTLIKDLTPLVLMLILLVSVLPVLSKELTLLL